MRFTLNTYTPQAFEAAELSRLSARLENVRARKAAVEAELSALRDSRKVIMAKTLGLGVLTLSIDDSDNIPFDPNQSVHDRDSLPVAGTVTPTSAPLDRPRSRATNVSVSSSPSTSSISLTSSTSTSTSSSSSSSPLPSSSPDTATTNHHISLATIPSPVPSRVGSLLPEILANSRSGCNDATPAAVAAAALTGRERSLSPSKMQQMQYQQQLSDAHLADLGALSTRASTALRTTSGLGRPSSSLSSDSPSHRTSSRRGGRDTAISAADYSRMGNMRKNLVDPESLMLELKSLEVVCAFT